jgi:hypothetical protein
VIGALGTLAAFLLAALASARAGGRSQSRASAILAIHALAAALWCGVASWASLVGPLSVMLFWGGALLAWLGVQLHLESSILLRMASIVARRPEVEESALVAAVLAEHGAQARIAELVRGGFVRERDGTLERCARGRFVARALALLERPPR